METTQPIPAPVPEERPFDSIELLGHVIPLVFAVCAIVLGALSPESQNVRVDKDAPTPKVEQIQQAR